MRSAGDDLFGKSGCNRDGISYRKLTWKVQITEATSRSSNSVSD
ncbi:MAG: hypothetical protein ACHBN1_24360 [Heteroscytonema crispum UTEX LB 1556]